MNGMRFFSMTLYHISQYEHSTALREHTDAKGEAFWIKTCSA